MTNRFLSNCNSHRQIVIGITLIYAVLVTLLSSFHEVWRDEVIPLSFVMESHSLAQVFAKLHNFGHPGLWHILLYFSYQVFPHPIVLKILNGLICVVAIYVFLSKSPFSWSQKILFVAGFFPLYLYPVFNRNYGISMLLVFLLCACYRDRWRRMIPLSIILFLLANTHLHSLVTVGAVVLSLLVELVFLGGWKEVPTGKRSQIFLGFGIIMTGMVLAVVQMLPDSKSLIFKPELLASGNVWEVLVRAVFLPGKYFYCVFGFENKFFVSIIIFAMYVYLLRKPSLLVMFSSGVVGISLTFGLAYFTREMRHQGAFYLLFIMVLWLECLVPLNERLALGRLETWHDYLRTHKNTLLSFILIIEVCLALPPARKEIEMPYSSAESLAHLIKRDSTLKEAIIMAMPESYLETLPYYLDNPLYFYSEERFARYRHLNATAIMTATMAEFLATGEKLKVNYGKPVLIILDEGIKPEGPYTLKFSYRKTFTYSLQALEEFSRQTTLLASFTEAISSERYRVYLLQ